MKHECAISVLTTALAAAEDSATYCENGALYLRNLAHTRDNYLRGAESAKASAKALRAAIAVLEADESG